MFIHIVGHDPDMRMAQQYVGDRLHLVPGIGSACRVGWRIQDKPFGLGRNRRLKSGPREFKAVLDGARNRYRLALRQQHHVGIAGPVRSGDDDLIARINTRHQRIIEHVLATVADGDLAVVVLQPILALQLAADG